MDILHPKSLRTMLQHNLDCTFTHQLVTVLPSVASTASPIMHATSLHLNLTVCDGDKIF